MSYLLDKKRQTSVIEQRPLNLLLRPHHIVSELQGITVLPLLCMTGAWDLLALRHFVSLLGTSKIPRMRLEAKAILAES